MEKLELKHIAPYLPYRLNVQYEGIVNLKELSDHKKMEPKDCDLFDEEHSIWYDNTPKEIKGKRWSEIKEIKFFKNHLSIHVGIKHGYLKTLNLDQIEPLLRPLSDLTQEIEHNGERFVPIIELFKLHNKNDFRVFPYSENYELDHYSHCVIYDDKNIFGYSNHGSFVGFTPGYCNFLILNQIELIEKLYEWHFDVFELIDKGLAIRKERGV